MDTRVTSTGSAPRRRTASALALAAWAILSGPTVALAAGAGLPGTEPRLLPPEQAFRFSARALSTGLIEARFDVAPGYYLYRDKLRFVADAGGPALMAPELPAGERKHDEFFGDVETYRGALVVRLPVANGTAGQPLVVKADSQGCADVGVCYPPNTQQVRLSLPAAGAGPGPLVDAIPPRKGLFN
jgi:thiol:disulfide interchange protein DsbD